MLQTLTSKRLFLQLGKLLVKEGVHTRQFLFRQFLVNQDAAAVLVHNDALALSDVDLTLRRNLDE